MSSAPSAPTTPQQVVELIQCNNAALEKAAAFMQQKEATDAAVQKLIPEAVEACLRHDRIDPAAKEKLAAALADHAKTVELIIKLAGHRNAEELRLGSAVEPTTIKSASTNPNYAGHRNRPGLAESDRKLFQGLGLPVPKE